MVTNLSYRGVSGLFANAVTEVLLPQSALRSRAAFLCYNAVSTRSCLECSLLSGGDSSLPFGLFFRTAINVMLCFRFQHLLSALRQQVGTTPLALPLAKFCIPAKIAGLTVPPLETGARLAEQKKRNRSDSKLFLNPRPAWGGQKLPPPSSRFSPITFKRVTPATSNFQHLLTHQFYTFPENLSEIRRKNVLENDVLVTSCSTKKLKISNAASSCHRYVPYHAILLRFR